MEGITLYSALSSLVVGVNGSASARTATLWAAAEAKRRGSRLHIVHAADTAGGTRCPTATSHAPTGPAAS
ncbi:universal stress protein [Streptomyces sp. NBC_01361]|uniref:universal stress protein n=1 Tax=Streptomyces sp. NBC_01361 TaxID=2903838 RepID=UPI002E2F13DA|nr:universal stress protein [Streptomyces sp. NBC_01361]